MIRPGTISGFAGRLLLVCCCISTVAVAGLFPHPVYSVGQSPLLVLVVDLNNDGRPDVVCGNDQSDDLSILLSDANGDLRPVGTLGPVSIDRFFHTGLASGDFNDDAIPDLVVGAIDLTLFLGLGDGTFAPAQQIATQIGSRAVVVADLNDDGLDDVANAGYSAGPISVLLGNGDGTFQAEGLYAAGNVRSIAVGDLDEDGALDLITANVSTDDVSLLLGIGDGTFAPEVRIAVGDSPFRVVTGDFDGDENLDVATLNDTSDDATVLFGAGDGSFAPDLSVPLANLPQAILAHDLDQDGRDDLVATTRNSEGALVYLGQADRSFDALGVQGAVSWSQSIGSGDFDLDGDPDLVLPSTLNDSVTVIMGSGDGTSEGYPIIDNTAGDAIAADVDHDGRTDVVGVDSSGVLVFVGNGDGSFQAPSAIPVGSDPTAVSATDFNGDEITDLALTLDGAAEVAVLLGTGGGSFAGQVRYPAATADALIIDDFNGDLDADLALLGTSVTILLGNGDGTLGAPATFAVGTFPAGLASGDFDQDQDRDLAVTNSLNDDVSILLGNGDGTFEPETRVAVGSNPIGIAIDDLDDDGRDDLIVANCACLFSGESVAGSGTEVSVRLGNGDGTFGPDTRFATGNLPAGIAVADLDNDGRADVTTANVGGEVSVLLADAVGGFHAPLQFEPGETPRSVAPADFEGDGRVDLVVSSNVVGSTFVAVQLGQGKLPPTVGFEADKTTLIWAPVFGADSYTVYRGFVSDLVDSDLDGLPDSGYGDCQGGASPVPAFTDPQQPPPGDGWFYVVGFVGPLGERGLGTTSAGLARQPAIACP